MGRVNQGKRGAQSPPQPTAPLRPLQVQPWGCEKSEEKLQRGKSEQKRHLDHKLQQSLSELEPEGYSPLKG